MGTYSQLAIMPSSQAADERRPLLERRQRSEDSSVIDDNASTASESSVFHPERRLSHINSHQGLGVTPEAGYTQFSIRHSDSKKSLRGARHSAAQLPPVDHVDDDQDDSPYMGVSKTRFWFIFTIILLQYFVRSHHLYKRLFLILDRLHVSILLSWLPVTL